MRVQLIAPILAAILFGPAVFAQSQPTPSPAPAKDPQAVTMLQTSLAALGDATQSAPTSIVASGTYIQFLSDSTVSYPLRAEVLGFDKFRWEVDTTDQGTIVTIILGTACWSQSPQGTEPIPVAEIPGRTFESFPALALSNWASSPVVGLKMIGPETLAGKAVYHVSVTPTLGGNTDPNREQIYDATQQREVFFDQQSNLPVRIRYYRHPIDWRIPLAMEVEYSNFQVVNGISFPMTITTYLGDLKLNQIQYQSLTLNAPVPDSDFLPEVTQ